jgi:predicted nucleic acid-binding protein
MQKVFVDTNIIVYAWETDALEKHHIANNLLKTELSDADKYISAQVLNELYAVLSKHRVPHQKIAKFIVELQEGMYVSPLTAATVNDSLLLKEKYRYSWWDSLILASALESGCVTVYSEDMQDGQLIENQLTIKNPF